MRTVLDFVRCDAAAIRKQYSVVLEKTLLELRGVACMTIEDAPAGRQQILVSRSFGKPATTVAAVVEAVSEFASHGREAAPARQRGGRDQRLLHDEPVPQARPAALGERDRAAAAAVPDSRLLVGAAAAAARRLFRSGFNYAKAGAMLLDLQDVGTQQGELDLFSRAEESGEPAGRDRSKRMEAMDVLNRRFGRDAVRIGSTALATNGAETRSRSVKQERRTPRYTTRWSEMPVERW